MEPPISINTSVSDDVDALLANDRTVYVDGRCDLCSMSIMPGKEFNVCGCEEPLLLHNDCARTYADAETQLRCAHCNRTYELGYSFPNPGTPDNIFVPCCGEACSKQCASCGPLYIGATLFTLLTNFFTCIALLVLFYEDAPARALFTSLVFATLLQLLVLFRASGFVVSYYDATHRTDKAKHQLRYEQMALILLLCLLMGVMFASGFQKKLKDSETIGSIVLSMVVFLLAFYRSAKVSNMLTRMDHLQLYSKPKKQVETV